MKSPAPWFGPNPDRLDPEMNSLMINWDEQLVWCNTCGGWIPARTLWLNGTHEWEGGYPGEQSAHTVWEK